MVDRISVIIPARNEEATVGHIVALAAREASEVVVVDSLSNDGTAAEARRAGARVVRAGLPGKHHALRTGIAAAEGDLLVFLDGDIQNFWPHAVQQLAAPLQASPKTALAKAHYERPLGPDAGEGGRLTELCARPLIALLLPIIAHIVQPLAGEFAIRKHDTRDLVFAPGFAVDLGILLHCASRGHIAQVDLGIKKHRNRPLKALGLSAVQVAVTILHYANATTLSLPSMIPYHPKGDGSDVDIDVAFLPPVGEPGMTYAAETPR